MAQLLHVPPILRDALTKNLNSAEKSWKGNGYFYYNRTMQCYWTLVSYANRGPAVHMNHLSTSLSLL